jgi:uncharacterized phage infection (PIP) family protein YhgE
MNVKIKTCIIICIISFILGILIACGASYFIYDKASRKYAGIIAEANDRNKQLAISIDESIKNAERLQNTINKQREFINELTNGNTKQQDFTKRIADYNEQIRKIIDGGSSEK